MKKVGCWYYLSDENCGFYWFDPPALIKDGDVFVHNQGVLFQMLPRFLKEKNKR